MKINIHAGHNPDGKTACGAVGLIQESTEARKVKEAVMSMLKVLGHTVYDCTVDNGTSQSDVLKKIVDKCNKHKVDLDVSIHFNAGRNDKKGDGQTGGTEVYVYSGSSKAKAAAESVCKSISALGFRNRGVKTSTALYVLRHTDSPAMLIECCFVDDKDDVTLYNYKDMAEAIVYGLTGKRYTMAEEKEETKEQEEKKEVSYLVRVTADVLNVRSGPGTGYGVVSQVKKGDAFTIVEEDDTWGKLKSGAGWISLKYTEKV